MSVKNINPGQKVSPDKIKRAKELRRGMTPAEALLWHELRGHKLGVHFRRQQIIAGFIVDYYCHAAGLVLEVDGAVHEPVEQRQADVRRDEALRGLGLRVLHLRNREITQAMPRVLDRIQGLLIE